LENVDKEMLTLSAEIVTSYLSNNSVDAGRLPELIVQVHKALSCLKKPAEGDNAPHVPATSVRGSVKSDHIVCLEDGKKLKLMKRHLATVHGMTPAQYRAKWNLPSSYPMVAPEYAVRRRELANVLGANFGSISRRVRQGVPSDGQMKTKMG